MGDCSIPPTIFARHKNPNVCYRGLQLAANFACLWMRSPVSQRCEQRTHTVCLPDARPPVCTPSAAFQFLTLPQLALSQPLSHSRAIFLCRWCLRALARCHERQVPMCQCRYAPPLNTFLPEGDSRHPHLTCVSACLEGTWSTTDHDFARCAPTASTRLGDSTADVVGRSS